MAPRQKVLLIAEACNPEWVSVPLVGWSMTAALRQVADVHLVTQVRNREALSRAGLTEGKDFTAIDSEAVARPLWAVASVLRMGKGKGWTTVQAFSMLSYRYFEYLLWHSFKERLRRHEFDLVHRITPLSPTIPSTIARRCSKIGVPFVIGPLNGGVPWPKHFDMERRQEREWLSYVRGLYKLIPGRRSTLNARAIIVGSRYSESEIPESAQGRTVYIPENGIDSNRFALTAGHDSGKLRATFVGRMVPYKGPDMALQAALPLIKAGAMTLDFVGDGPLLEGLKDEVRRHELEDSVTFHGWVPHEAVSQLLARSSLFLFPSIREFGGGAVLEAMAVGVPPLIVDYAGPGELVDDTTGYKVPLGTRAEIVAALGEQLQFLAKDPKILRRTGNAARRRVEQYFLWERKAEQIAEVYRFAVGQKPLPRFFPSS